MGGGEVVKGKTYIGYRMSIKDAEFIGDVAQPASDPRPLGISAKVRILDAGERECQKVAAKALLSILFTASKARKTGPPHDLWPVSMPGEMIGNRRDDVGDGLGADARSRSVFGRRSIVGRRAKPGNAAQHGRCQSYSADPRQVYDASDPDIAVYVHLAREDLRLGIVTVGNIVLPSNCLVRPVSGKVIEPFLQACFDSSNMADSFLDELVDFRAPHISSHEFSHMGSEGTGLDAKVLRFGSNEIVHRIRDPPVHTHRWGSS